MAAPSAPELPSCAICFEDSSHPGFSLADLPCCGSHTSSTTQFCVACIKMICAHGDLNVGKCPRCRKFIGMSASGTIELRSETGTCEMCRQKHIIVGHRKCAACLFGSDPKNRHRYECDRCHRFQRIPHPMYR
ncbi:hypothetical protein TeGR_g5858 [Tetraparma gracilis]|uniref:RING-type domain-containing protein n=1 Tax=Tetraparma gracilis TaxID=2962635 RepID=A0ABQ6MLF7_9STRA|nr:hypothetical protein TeGR_g5858 [Tetraparma gracilis]